MLDTETDVRMRSDIQYTLTSMLQTLAPDNLTHWLGLCRDVLSATKANKGSPQDQKADARSEGEEDADIDRQGALDWTIRVPVLDYGYD